VNIERIIHARRRALILGIAAILTILSPSMGNALTGSGAIERVSLSSTGIQGNDFSSYAVLSADGRYVAFDSQAPDLVPQKTNRNNDVFVRDTLTGTTTRVSVSSSGTQGNGSAYFAPSINAGGRYVAFTSAASNLVSGTPTARGTSSSMTGRPAPP
jgi:Tol biopolymer transport system component